MLCPAPPCIHAPSPAEGTLYHQHVCALCGPALFCAFVIPDQSSCCLPPVIVMQPRAWRVVMSGGYGPCHDERCALKPMHPSLHYCLCIHEHVPPMPSCAQVPLPSAAHPRYRRYLPPALPPLPPAVPPLRPAPPLLLASSSQRPLLPPSRVPVATAAAATTAALASLAAAADRHGCSATSDLTYCRCLCYRRRSTVAIAVGWNVVCCCVCDTRRIGKLRFWRCKS